MHIVWRLSAIITIVYSACALNPVYAENLLDLYMLAVKNDAKHQQSIAERDVLIERYKQAVSQLLPNISLTANTTNYNQDVSAAGFGNSGKLDFNSHGYELQLIQPLFKRGSLTTVDQAKIESLRAKARVVQSRQELMIRVTERYFAVLAEQDALKFARAEKKSLAYQLKRTKEYFNVGLAIDADLQEAQAGYDRAIAAEINANNALDNAVEEMREITNSYSPELAPLNQDIPLSIPVTWSEQELQNNITVLIAQHALDAAEREIKKQSAKHYPTVNLITQYGYTSGGGRFGVNKTNSTAIGLNLNLPIFQGGATHAQVQQAYAEYRATLARLEQTRRAVRRQAQQAYLSAVSGINQIKALKQTIVSSEAALAAISAGFKVGTRTAIDVVIAEQATFSAHKDYAQARYAFLLNKLRLKQVKGEITIADLQQLNTLFTTLEDE